MSVTSISGKLDKQAMFDLARARRTLEFARLDGIDTTAVRRLAELVRLCESGENETTPVHIPAAVFMRQEVRSQVAA